MADQAILKPDRRIREKVKAGTLGAGLGAGGGMAVAQPISQLLVELLAGVGLPLSEVAQSGVYALVVILLASCTSFAFGYMRREP